MCLGVPGQVLEFIDPSRHLAKVEISGVRRNVNVGMLIPDGLEAHANAYDSGQSRRANVRVLSVYDLDRQVTSDGATWLDRQPRRAS